jgi:hypothetical protein
MRELREHLVELAEAGERAARVPGAQAAIGRGRRRHRRLVAAVAVLLVALGGGVAAVDRWSGGWGLTGPPTGGRPRPPATTLQPIDPARLFDDPESPKPVGPLRLLAEGTFKGRHWAFYLFRERPAPPDPPGVRWCEMLVDWAPDGTLAGWHVGCGLEHQQLRAGRMLTVSLDEPVENQVFVYYGGVTRRAARIRFQIGDQPPFEARIIDPGPQFPNNWYIAVFSPEGGTRTMLDRSVRKTATVLDAAGQTICTTTVDPRGCG